MRCCVCLKKLRRPHVTLSWGGVMGPKCAKAQGIAQQKPSKAPRKEGQTPENNPGQLSLGLE